MNSPRLRAFFVALVLFLVLLVVPILLTASFFRTSDSMTTQAIVQQQTLSDIAVRAIQTKVEHLTSIATSMAASPQLITDFSQKNWTAASAVARDMQNNVDFYDSFIDRITILDNSGTQQAAFPKLSGGIGASFSSSSWFESLASGAPSAVSGVVKRVSTPQIQVINIAAPVKQNGETVGFVVLQIPTDDFLAFGQTISLGTYGFAYMVDSSANIIEHPRYTSNNDSGVVNLSSDPIVRAVQRGGSGTVISNDGGEPSVLTYEPISPYGWGLVTQEPYSEVFATRDDILASIAWEIAITVFVDLLLCYLVFRIMIGKKYEKQ